MRVVRTLLAVKIDRRIAGIVRRVILLTRTLKTLQACPDFDQRPVYRKVFIAGQVLIPRL
jgi:hypothetical protein